MLSKNPRDMRKAKVRVSIIVPAYNIKSYIDRCIISIINQSYTDIEVILVDDGSTDGSQLLCDQWIKRDSRVKVIHKSNGGLSSARNAGLDCCSGDYISFIDGDDYIDGGMIEALVDKAEGTSAEIAITGIRWINEADEVIDAESGIDALWGEREFWSALYQTGEHCKGFSGGYLKISCNKLFKKHLFQGERFDEGRIHEDEFVIHRLIRQCSMVVLVSGCYYNYVQRAGSIMHKRTQVSQCDACEAFMNRSSHLSSIGMEHESILALKDAITHSVMATDYPPLGDSRQTLKELRHHSIRELKQKDLSVLSPVDRFKTRCLCTFPRLYVYLFSLRNNRKVTHVRHD